jgi:hypothetical protein
MEIGPDSTVVEVKAATVIGVFPMHLAKTYRCAGCHCDTQMCRAGLLQLNCASPTIVNPATIITMDVIKLMSNIEEENPSVSPNHLARALSVLHQHRRGKIGMTIGDKQLREAMFATQELQTATKCATGAYPVNCPACV